MHISAMLLGEAFMAAYARDGGVVVDLGAYDLNGSLRTVCPPGMRYLGVDMASGPGVDLVVEPGAPLPLEDDYADLVVSSSAFEHDDAFWLTFLDLVRITKPGGFIYLNVPSNGHVHAHPDDCWRFYPDAGRALERWARRQGRPATLIESFVGERRGEFWNDFVAVFYKGELASSAGLTFLSDGWPATNIRRWGVDGMLQPRRLTEDMVLMEEAVRRARELKASLGDHCDDIAELLAPSASVEAAPLVSTPPDLGPLVEPKLSAAAIDMISGTPAAVEQVVRRTRNPSLAGWVFADEFDAAEAGSRRYLVLEHPEAGRLFADLGPPVERLDVAEAYPQADPRFTSRSGFSVRLLTASLPPGAYRLGFVLANPQGARFLKIPTLLTLG